MTKSPDRIWISEPDDFIEAIGNGREIEYVRANKHDDLVAAVRAFEEEWKDGTSTIGQVEAAARMFDLLPDASPAPSSEDEP